jgi:hypothetical protein
MGLFLFLGAILVFVGGGVFEAAGYAPVYQKRGAQLVTKLIHTPAVIPACAAADSEHLRDSVGLVWYLDSIATGKGQSVQAGMYILEDADSALFNFLTSYKNVYRRKSSHFPDSGHPHYGIDIPRAERHAVFLPYGNRHILFGKTPQDGHIFIEPQKYGTRSLGDLVLHVREYIKYRCVQRVCPLLLERDGIRHEAVPYSVQQSWNHLKRTVLLTVDQNLAGVQTIKEMVALAHHVSKNHALTESQQQAMNGFYETLKPYQSDLHERIGREVRIKREELVQ